MLVELESRNVCVSVYSLLIRDREVVSLSLSSEFSYSIVMMTMRTGNTSPKYIFTPEDFKVCCMRF